MTQNTENMTQNTENAVRVGLNRALKAGVKAAFEQGRLLTVASEELSKQERSPGWEHQPTFAEWYATFGISKGEVSRLMTLYGNEPLRDRWVSHEKHLPTSVYTLYQLARIPEDKLKTLFDEDDKLIASGTEHGVIYKGMSRDEAHQVALRNGVPGGGGGNSDTNQKSRKELAEQVDQQAGVLETLRRERDEAQQRAEDAERAMQELRNETLEGDALEDETLEDETPSEAAGGQSPATKPANAATTVSAPSEAILTAPVDELVKLLLTRDDITEVVRELTAQLPVAA